MANQLAKQIDYAGDQVIGACGQFCEAVSFRLSDQFVLLDFEVI